MNCSPMIVTIRFSQIREASPWRIQDSEWRNKIVVRQVKTWSPRKKVTFFSLRMYLPPLQLLWSSHTGRIPSLKKWMSSFSLMLSGRERKLQQQWYHGVIIWNFQFQLQTLQQMVSFWDKCHSRKSSNHTTKTRTCIHSRTAAHCSQQPPAERIVNTPEKTYLLGKKVRQRALLNNCTSGSNFPAGRTK